MPARSSRAITSSFCLASLSIASCGVFSPVTARRRSATRAAPASGSPARWCRSASTRRAPGCGRTRPGRRAWAPPWSSARSGCPTVADRRQADEELLQRGRLGDAELRVEPGRLAALQRRATSASSTSPRPGSRASCPPPSTGRAATGPCATSACRPRSPPAGRAWSSDAVNAVYQKICCAMLPWPGTGPASEKVMPGASGGAYFFSQSMYFVERVDGRRAVRARRRG